MEPFVKTFNADWRNAALRSLSACIILMSIYGLLFYASSFLWGAFLMLILALLIYECLQMMRVINHWAIASWIWIILGMMSLCMWQHIFYPWVYVAGIWWSLTLILITIFLRHGRLFFYDLPLYMLMMIPWFLPAIMSLYQAKISGHVVTIWILMLMTASVDIFAYILGKALGKRTFFSKISPHKTLEGLCGGILGGLSCGYGLCAWYQLSWQNWKVLAVAFFFVLMAILGDLFESMMKRLHNIKDSGSIIPGHGGILDRMDSVLATLGFFPIWLLILS